VFASLLLTAALAQAQQGWGSAFSLGPGAGTPAAAADHRGNAVVAWLADTGAGAVVRARRYEAANALWQAPVDLSAASDPLSFGNPIAAVDTAGNVMVIWRRSGIFAARYSVATDTWAAPVAITPPPASPDCSIWESIRVAVDPVGRGLVVWVETCRGPFLSYTFTVHVARYAPDTGTVTEAVLSEPANGVSTDVDVAVDQVGNATVLWSQRAPTAVMQTSSFTAATAEWTAPTSLLPNPYDLAADGARMASDAVGRITAVWRVTDVNNRSFIRAARYDASSRAWAHMADLGVVASPLFVQKPVLAVDPAGNAAAMWEEAAPVPPVPTRRLRAALYRDGSATWCPAVEVSPPGNLAPGASVAPMLSAT
jgi:hypothetical protein